MYSNPKCLQRICTRTNLSRVLEIRFQMLCDHNHKLIMLPSELEKKEVKQNAG